MARRIILFEINEVPWRVVDDFTAAHPRAPLAESLRLATQYETRTEDTGHLTPWTTWPSLHRGVPDEAHLIADLGQDRSQADRDYPPIWQLLSGAGVSVGLCGSLHSYPLPADLSRYRFYLPDVFAPEPDVHPADLVPFQRFMLRMVRASGRNVDTGVPRDDALAFLAASRSVGVTRRTFFALARQLLLERRRPWLSARRRSLQALLTFDVFARLLETTKPQFATFHTNHVASAMHRFWAAAYPGDYDSTELGEQWRERFRGEIGWAMQQAGTMLADLVAFTDRNPEYQLWIASSRGQAATRALALETQLYLTDLDAFMAALDVVPSGKWEARPAMLPRRGVHVDASHADVFAAALQQIRVDGAPLTFRRAEGTFFSLDWGQPNLHDRGEILTVDGQTRPLASMGLRTVEIEDRSDTTAYHVPEGILAIYDPQDVSPKSPARQEVSALSLAPAILENFGLTPPLYMRPSLLAAGETSGI